MFAQVRLSEATQTALKQNLRGPELIKLNRALLEEAYPAELAKAGAAAAAAAPAGGDFVRTNRLLLEDTYPEIEKLQAAAGHDAAAGVHDVPAGGIRHGAAGEVEYHEESYFCNFRIYKVKSGEYRRLSVRCSGGL